MNEFMEAAIEQARIGLAEGGIPIGSVLIKNGQIVGRGHNRRVQDRDPVAHAEIDCLRNAGRIGGYRGAILYSTLTPCFMCAGAAIQFGIGKIVIGDSETYAETLEFVRGRGIEVIEMRLPECVRMLAEFAVKNPELWREDSGDL